MIKKSLRKRIAYSHRFRKSLFALKASIAIMVGGGLLLWLATSFPQPYGLILTIFIALFLVCYWLSN